MTKLTAEERLAITLELETLFEKECRPCKKEGKEHLSTCAGCDTFTTLRAFGNRLEGGRKPPQEIPIELRRLAQENGVSYVTLTRRLANGMQPEDAIQKRIYERWGKVEDRKIMKWDAEGVAPMQIAERLDRSAQSVRTRLHKLRKRGNNK